MMEMVVLLFGNKSLSENSLSEMQNAKFKMQNGLHYALLRSQGLVFSAERSSLRSKPDE